MLDIALQVPTSSIYSLFGPSAAGKSSILHVMAGFEHAFSSAFLAIDGRVLLNHSKKRTIHIPAWQRGIVLVEQGAKLFPHLSVRENIYYGIQAPKDIWVDKWIERFGLDPYLNIAPHQLSGGLTQRAVLARAIAKRPRTLLLDEAFSALDAPLRRILQDAILDIRDEIGTTILLVTHQLAEAQRMADYMGVLNHGRILQQGTPEQIMFKPTSWEVAKLLGYTHLLTDRHDRKFALHPNRVIPGAFLHAGPVMHGIVKQYFWQDASPWVMVELPTHPDTRIELAMPIQSKIQVQDSFTFTVLDPPYFEDLN